MSFRLTLYFQNVDNADTQQRGFSQI